MATKPNRTQAKQIYALVGSTPTRRVQSLDWNSNFTTDSVYELGNSGIVEDSISLVETGVTMNSNEWGTCDLEAQIFGVFEQRNIVTTNGTNTTATIHTSAFGAGGHWADSTAALAAGDWLQIIRQNANATTNACEYVEVRTVTASGYSDTIRLTGTNSASVAPSQSDIVTLVNKYTITEDTVDANPVHLMLPHRYSAASTVMMHSIALPRCYCDSLSYNIDVGGAAEQNYSLVGEEERMYLNNYREARTVTGSFIAYGTLTGSVGLATVQFRIPFESDCYTDHTPLACYCDSNLIGSDGSYTTSDGVCTIIARIGTGLGLDSSTQITYYYSDDDYRGYKGVTNLDSGIGKLTKGYCEIWFGTSDDAAEKLLRATSVAINVPLGRESIEEIGESRSIAKPLEGNIRNEVTLGFNKNDLREYAKMLGESAAFDAGTLNEILMTDLKSVTNGIITVYFYNSQTTHDATTLLKTISFTSCSFIGSSSSGPISGAHSLELQFSSQTLSIEGSGLPPVYS